MRRPNRDSIASLHPLRRNLSLDLIAAIGLGISGAMVGTFLPTIARRGGLEPLGLAALAAAPFLANLLSAFAGRLGPRSTRHLALLRGVGAGSLFAIAVLPTPAVIIAASLVFWMSVTFGGPFHIRLWGLIYPGRMRGRVVGFLGTGRSAAAMLAALAGGLLADRIGGPTAVGLGGLLGAACALGYAGLRASASASASATPPAYSARDSIRAIDERPLLGRIVLAQSFFGGGLVAAGPLFALVNVDRLDLSLADVGIIGVVGAGATTLSFLMWGAVADRFGALAPLRIGSLIGLGGLLAYALAPAVAVLWVAAAAIGACNASIEIGVTAVISEETPLATRAAALSGWNALLGVRGLFAAFSMSTLVQVGVVDVTSGLLLCGAASGVGVALYWWTARRTKANDDHGGRDALGRGRGEAHRPHSENTRSES